VVEFFSETLGELLGEEEALDLDVFEFFLWGFLLFEGEGH
jgi:hypothetical protein